MLNRVTSRRARQAGVTLFELLLCIGLISIIASLAMPFYSSAENAKGAMDRRNAQTFCSMHSILQAAGVAIPVGEGDAKMQILEALRTGVSVDTGPLRGRIIRVANVGDEQVAGAAQYLTLQPDGQLVYDGNIQDR